MTINPVQNAEMQRMQRNLTQTQKKTTSNTQEGVLVNNFIMEDDNFSKVNNSLLIPSNSTLPAQLNEPAAPTKNSIVPVSIISTAVMLAVTGLTFLAKRNAKANLNVAPIKKLPSLTRNCAVNEETHQAIYQMVQCPNQKTIFAGIGMLSASAMAFTGKMFFDGYKDVWIKRKEADIQKDLQENLISIETQSFAGKIQINRNLLAEKSKEFNKIIYGKDSKKNVQMNRAQKQTFQGTSQPPKTSENDKQSKNRLGTLKSKVFNEGTKNLLIGAATVLGIGALGFVSIKNMGKCKKHLDEYISITKDAINDIAKNSTPKNQQNEQNALEKMFQSIEAEPQYIKDTIDKLNWDKAAKNTFGEKVLAESTKSTTKANSALGGDGTPKPSFYSHVNDFRAFMYNWLLDTSNTQFKNLFLGITGVTGVSYGGKVAGEAIKDVKVKKENAQTELNLQRRLVSTELRNFKTKKEAAIQPLCDEFHVNAKNNMPKEELKIMADNILLEIKNGPPFVYA